MREKSPETLRITRYKRRDKCAEHKERTLLRFKLSAQEQLLVLDNRLGIGIGAVKERKRLHSMIGKD